MFPVNLVDMIRGSLFVLAHWTGGSLGGAIVVASVTLRLALLPITFAATKRRLVREAQMRELAPELAAVKKRFANEPEKVLTETQRVYDAHGIPMLDTRGLVSGFLQFPPAALLYSAIRGITRESGGFLWMSNLVSPDRVLALAASVVAGGMAWVSASAPEGRQAAQFVPVVLTGVITLVALSHMSAGVALYSLASSVVSGAEQAVARRLLRARV